LAALGSPHQHLPPVIHVAGTNGKGSTLAFLRASLEAGGYRVHAFTKPHLVRFNERIRLDGTLIDELSLSALLEECESANGGRPITYFEITTAAAFLAFARTPADIVLLETGLGGRFDATNVVARPAATVITPVSLDHQHFLGHTVALIAGEKAGILKPGVVAVLGPQSEEGRAVLEARARALGAPLHRFGHEWQVEPVASGLHFRGKRWDVTLPPPGLFGRHQYDNAGAALACLEWLDDFPLDRAALAAGMRRVEWPARLQRLTRGPLVDLLPRTCELWLDGGHNQAGGEALARVAEGWGPEKPLGVVFGMLNSHDAEAFLRPLRPFVKALATVTIPGEPNALTAEAAAAAGRQAGMAATPYPDIASAVGQVARAHGRVLISGSLYLAGRVLGENG